MKDIKPNATYSEVRQEGIEWPKYRSKEYFQYRKAWSDYPLLQHVSNFPLHLDIETTNVCNLECTMCPRTIEINKGTYGEIGTMSMDLYKKIIDEGAEEGLCSIKLNYLGEPLADKYIIERISYAKQKGIIEVMFNTNASLLTEIKSKELLEAGLDSIFFSVDGIIPDSFNKIRIGTDYETVVNNVLNFVKIKNDGNYKHVQTRVSMTMLPGMEVQVSAFTEYWLPIVGTVGYGEWVNHGVHGEYPYNPDFMCSQPFQRMFIMWDGIATPCCVDSTRAYVLGDVNHTSIKDIWHGEKLEKMRQAQTTGNYRDIEMCRKCYVPAAKLG